MILDNVNVAAVGSVGIIEAIKHIPITDETIGLYIQIAIGIVTIAKIIISKQRPFSKESIEQLIRIFKAGKELKEIGEERAEYEQRNNKEDGTK